MTGKTPYPYPWPLQFLINGQPMSKKRNWYPMWVKGHLQIGLSALYKAWEKGAVSELWVQKHTYAGSMLVPWLAIAEPVLVEFHFFLKRGRLIDLSNLYQGPEDALQAAGILKDDEVIAGHDRSRRHYGVDNPHITITITPFIPLIGG